uniref:G-protein coupled receptors family 1 profile domain-containing protein n=1 Tax=Maylandia zebra TaxID=106582 RepID=A0A3P9DQK2_9CICH
RLLAVQNKTPIIYYTNLLIATVIQICTMMMMVSKPDDRKISNTSSLVFYCAVMANLYFKVCIALERYLFIACPLLDCIRQTKGSVLLCVLVWALCIVSIPPATVLQQYFRLICFTLLPGLPFIYCLIGILQALPAATAVPTEEKRRIAGTLVLLLLNYFLIVLPTTIFYILIVSLHYHFDTDIPDIVLTLSLLSPFVDLTLFCFMRKGPIDKLLACLCCCSMDSPRCGFTSAETSGEKKEKQNCRKEREFSFPHISHVCMYLYVLIIIMAFPLS